MLGISAFAGNSNLPLVFIPSSNPQIEANAFPNGYVVETKKSCFAFEIKNKANSETNNVNGNKTTITDYYSYEDNDTNSLACPTSVVIPRKIVSVAYEAFKNKNLTSLVFPPSLTTIENFAFQGNSLTSLTLPDSITSLGQGVFVL